MGFESLGFQDRTGSWNNWLWLGFDEASLDGVPGRARRDEERAEAAAVEAYVAGYDSVAGAALGVAVAVGVEDEGFGRAAGFGFQNRTLSRNDLL